jgi:photosystem II stability/assembly factor-like uncharacterized protein
MFRVKSCFSVVVMCVALLPSSLLAQEGTSRPPRRTPPKPDERKSYDKPAEAADFNVRKRVTGIQSRAATVPPVPAIPVERYQAALARIRSMPQYSTATGQVLPAGTPGHALGTWTEIGPGNIGGRTRQLVFEPGNPDVMYATAVAGGVWKSTNGGQSWVQLTDLAIPNIAVNSLAIDPRSPSTLYAGTGEGYFNVDVVRGAGIFKTTDGGRTWARLASTATADFRFVNDVVVSPRNSNRLYVATRTGVWMSTNGGNTWNRGLNGSSVLGCFDLAVQPAGDQGFIFASCGTFDYGAASGIYRATDDGGGRNTWQQVYTETNIGRTSLAIAPSNPNVIYALAADAAPGIYQDGLRAVFRSDAAGAPGTWTTQVRNTDPNKLNTLLLSNPVFGVLAECHFGAKSAFFNQGWYDNVIAVDPIDPDRVWAGGVDLFRSDDGGHNWGVASYWWFSGGVDGTPTEPNYAHADQHVIAFHPEYNGTTNKTMLVASDGGVSRTDDARANVGTAIENVCGSPVAGAVTWRSLNNGYAVTQFYHGTVYPDGQTFFGGTQDNGTIHGSLQTSAWREIQGGDGGYVAVDPLNTSTLFAEFTGLSITRSRDGGATFTDATSGINNDPGFAFIAPIHMNPANSQQLMTGGWYIWRTTNQADSWQRASAITPGQGSVSAIGVSPVNSNRAVIGMSDGFLLFSSAANSANHTTSWAFSRPRQGFVSSVHWDPTNVDIVYATYATFNTQTNQSHVYRSTDGGRTWTGLDGTGTTGLPDLPVHALIVDPLNTQRLYVGTDAGVFTSIDGGANWYKEVTGYANVVTEALSLSTVGDIQLYAFTHGRSAWRVKLNH